MDLFKDKTKFKEKDNFECAACHDENPQPVTVGGVQFAKGIKERAPGHTECFVCHFNEKEVDKTSKTFATNCVGCHNLDKKEKGTGSELAVLWFDREMKVYCGATAHVKTKVERFIDEGSGRLVELATDAYILDGVVCESSRSSGRWFCSRAIYPYWRECWLERLEPDVSESAPPGS